MKRRWTSVLAGFAASISAAAPCAAQIACIDAPMQLQQYVNQVGQLYDYWYFTGIPMNCGNNGYCANSSLAQLNMWSSQQTAMINQWYYQIAVSCTNRPPPQQQPLPPPAPNRPIGTDVAGELRIDQNTRKTVTIVIPDNPNGFRTRP